MGRLGSQAGKEGSPGPRERGGGERAWRAGPATRPRDLFTSEVEVLRPCLPPPSAPGLACEAVGPQDRGPRRLPGRLAGRWKGPGLPGLMGRAGEPGLR